MTVPVLTPCYRSNLVAHAEHIAARIHDISCVLHSRESHSLAIADLALAYAESWAELDEACEELSRWGMLEFARKLELRTLASVRGVERAAAKASATTHRGNAA